MHRHLDGSPKPVDPDPDAIGPTARCGCAATCRRRIRCGSRPAARAGRAAATSAPIGIRAAIRLMGPEATVRQLERRLRCSRCGNRQVGIVLQPDTRPPEMQERDGPRPETRAGLPD